MSKIIIIKVKAADHILNDEVIELGDEIKDLIIDELELDIEEVTYKIEDTKQ